MGKGSSDQARGVLNLSGTPSRETIIDNIRRMGFPQAFEVGGCVRDELLGNPDPNDIDIAVCGLNIDEVLAKCRKEGWAEENIVSGRLVGARLRAPWTPEEGVEISLSRTEVSTGPLYTDFDIHVGPEVPIEEDLKRRDFTINAIARNLETNELIDPFDGQGDIKRKILKTVSPESFRDDPVRILRGIRFEAQLGFKLDEEAKAQASQYAANISKESGERIMKEMKKLMKGPYAADALRTAREVGALEHMMPELKEAIGFNQESRYHDLTCDDHILLAVQRSCEWNAPESVRWAALLHDSGKPASSWRGSEGRLHFYENRRSVFVEHEGEILQLPKGTEIELLDNPEDPENPLPVIANCPEEKFNGMSPVNCPEAHEVIGAGIAEQAMDRLHSDKDFKQKVTHLIRHHMYKDDENFASLSEAKQARRARRFLAKVGREHAEELMLLRRCDRAAKQTDMDLNGDWDRDMKAFEEAVRAQWNQPLTIKELAVGGEEIMEHGIKGEPVGKVLRRLLKHVVDNPENNRPERLAQETDKIIKELARSA